MSASQEPSVLRTLLDDPGVFVAGSWLEIIYFVAGAVAVIIAIIQLRKNVMQSRAAFLLQLGDKWENLATPRKEARVMYDHVRKTIFRDYADKSDASQERQLRAAYKEYLETLRKNEPDRFVQLSEYWTFFETVGLMVRKRYMPFHDVYLLYKGSLIEIERACTEFVQEWQKEAHRPPGLLENMLRIADRAKRRQRIESVLASLNFWKKDG